MRNFPILLFFGSVMPVFAEHRSAEELIATTHAVLAERNIIVSPQNVRGEKSGDMQILFELEKVAVVGYSEGGFAIIAKDTDHETLWGYSTSPFDTKNPAPGFLDLIRSINDGMAKGKVESTRYSVCRALDDNNLPDHVDPLIKTQWDQRAPYNNLTPSINEEPCLTGCTATALAQIVNYYRRPNRLEGMERARVWNENEETSTYFEVDLSTLRWDFDQMVSNYGTEDFTEAQASSVANLMYACGLKLHVIYHEHGTGGGFASTSFRGLNYKTKSSWTLRDLAEGNPIIYESVDHAMIIDGYDENGFLHFNFGWGGREDGFYALDNSEFKYHYTGDNSNIPGYVVTHFDKTSDEYGEYYVNPRTHEAVLENPHKIDNEHLKNKNVYIPYSITFEGEEYVLNFNNGEKPFANTDATSFTLAEGITIVPKGLTEGCEEVKEIHLPSTLQHVPDYALHRNSIKDVYCAAMVPPTVGTKALPEAPWTPAIMPKKIITIHVPAEAIEAYRQAPGWNAYEEYVAIDGSTGIEESFIETSIIEEQYTTTYDLSGRNVSNTKDHGIYIVNGRKVIR